MRSKPTYPRSYFTNRPADRTHNFVITSCCAVGVYSGPDRKAQQADKAWKPGLNNTDKYEAKIDRTAGTRSPSGGDLISSSYQLYLWGRTVLARTTNTLHWRRLIRLYCLPSLLGQQEISVCRRSYQDWTALISGPLSHQYSPPQNNKYVHSRAKSGLYSFRYYLSDCNRNYPVCRRHKCKSCEWPLND